MLRDRKLVGRKFRSIIIRSTANLFKLDFYAEQQPNPASRITLTDMRDALGSIETDAPAGAPALRTVRSFYAGHR